MKINGKDIHEFSNDALAYTRDDLQGAVNCAEEMVAAGWRSQKRTQYLDELLAVAAEIERRKARKVISLNLTEHEIVALIDALPDIEMTLSSGSLFGGLQKLKASIYPK